MNIKEFLATENNARLVNGNRWLVIVEVENHLTNYYYIVHEHKYRAKHTTTIIETEDEAAAIEALKGE